MKKFYTLTTTGTQHTATNSRKFDSFDDAIDEARKRLAGGFRRHGAAVEFEDIVIMVSFALVKPECPPIRVTHPFED